MKNILILAFLIFVINACNSGFDIKENSNKKQFEFGQLLLNTTDPMGDPRFKETAILLIGEQNGYVQGLVLNRPSNVKITNFFKNKAKTKISIYNGGPVQAEDLVFCLHTLGDSIPKSKTILPGLYYSICDTALANLLEAGKLNEKNTRLFTGFTQWNNAQLNQEIVEHAWQIFPTNAPEVMDYYGADLWMKNASKMKQYF